MYKAEAALRKMAEIFVVEAAEVEEYVRYFDITLIPATVFFYNAKHIKIDSGYATAFCTESQLIDLSFGRTQDHTKFIGAFYEKQDFIDLVEVVMRGAIRGKAIVTNPIPKEHIPKFNLIYKGI